MPAGDLLANRGDLEWDELLISDASGLDQSEEGYYYDATAAAIEGLGVPALRPVEVDRDGDGTFGAANGGRSGRQIVLDGLAACGRDAVNDLRRRMIQPATLEPLCFQGLGPAQSDTDRFVVFPTRCTFTYSEDAQMHRHNIAVVTAEWYCDDPLIYSLTETATVVDGTNPTVANVGIAAAPWVLTIVAGGSPVVGPRVRRMDDPTRYLIDFAELTIPAGETLTLDTRPGREFARLSTGSYVTGMARNGSRLAEWWRIPPGGVSVGAASDSGSFTATMAVRAAYL